MDEPNETKWINVHETYDYIGSELIEAILRDNDVEYLVKNKADNVSDELGNRVMNRISTGIPIIFYVKDIDTQKAIEIINMDRSEMLDDPELDFGELED